MKPRSRETTEWSLSSLPPLPTRWICWACLLKKKKNNCSTIGKTQFHFMEETRHASFGRNQRHAFLERDWGPCHPEVASLCDYPVCPRTVVCKKQVELWGLWLPVTVRSAHVDKGRETTWAGLVYNQTENRQTQMRIDGFIEHAGWSQMRCDCPELSDDPYSMQNSLSGWSVPTSLKKTSLHPTATAKRSQSWTAALRDRFLPTTITFFYKLMDLGCHCL